MYTVSPESVHSLKSLNIASFLEKSALSGRELSNITQLPKAEEYKLYMTRTEPANRDTKNKGRSTNANNV